jgi:hypothetical protein
MYASFMKTSKFPVNHSIYSTTKVRLAVSLSVSHKLSGSRTYSLEAALMMEAMVGSLTS